MMNTRHQFSQARRVVVKVGINVLTLDQGLNLPVIASISHEIGHLMSAGRQVILVSSGAMAAGMRKLQLPERPSAIPARQAVAAVGQAGLILAYENAFDRDGRKVAQILLTAEDMTNRKRYLNARNTLNTLLEWGVVPIVNENDTVATDELRFGDNDTLAALAANLVEADLLVLLTDQMGLFDGDPRIHHDATLISESRVNEPLLDSWAGAGTSGLGRGGMVTKVRAARLAARSGTATIIAPGAQAEVLSLIARGEETGTLLLPAQGPDAARKRWLAGHLQVRGRLVLDAGAVRVLQESGRSLLAVGVKKVVGGFSRGEVVSCVDLQGQEVARGLVNYGAEEADRIKGEPSSRIQDILGYVDEEELIHRDNLVLV